jgi:hypothetical protein
VCVCGGGGRGFLSVLYVYFELGCLQREGMGLLEYRAMPSLRGVAHDGVLCKLRSAPDRGELTC